MTWTTSRTPLKTALQLQAHRLWLYLYGFRSFWDWLQLSEVNFVPIYMYHNYRTSEFGRISECLHWGSSWPSSATQVYGGISPWGTPPPPRVYYTTHTHTHIRCL